MKKPFLLITVMLMIGVHSISAQEKKWRTDFGVRYSRYSSPIEDIPAVNIVNLEVSPLYSVTEIFSAGPVLGLGMGFNSLGTSFEIPLYATGKFKFSKKNITPYLSMSVGMLIEVSSLGTAVGGILSPRFGLQADHFNIYAGYEMLFAVAALHGFTVGIGVII